MNRKTLAVQVGIALAASVSSASAQQSPGFALEEVVVTAQKREQSMQDVPISVQAFSSQAIRELGATVMSDLEHIAPSFEMGGLGNGSQQNFGLRGIVDYSRNVGVDSRMGVYIDGVFQGRSFSADKPLLGLESVEILRGPQGTLFGKNTVSGAINLVTKRPGEETEGEFQVEYGNEGYARGAGYLSGKLTDTLYASGSLSYDENDGYYRNTTLNKDTGDYDRTAWRAKVLWLPTDRLEIILAGDGSDYDSNDVIASLRTEPAFKTSQNYESNDEVKFWGSSATVNYDIGEYTLTSISAYRDSQYDTEHDDDLTPLDIQVSYRGEDTDQFSQELRLVSPKLERYDWVAGLYYFDGDQEAENRACFGVDLYNLLIPPLAPFAEALKGCGVSPAKVTSETYAAYLHGNYRFSEKWELTAGVRYTYEEKDVRWEQFNEPNDPATAAVLEGLTGLPLTQAPGALFGAINYDPFTDDRDEDDVSPTIGINFFPNEQVLIYAKYARGFKSGGYNADFMTDGLEFFEYEDESVDSYEIGIKSTLFDDTLQLNATGFISEFDDYQVFQFVTNSEGANTLQLTNAAQATTQGVELETVYIPTARLRFIVNATWLDASYDEFANPDPEQPDFDDNDLPYAPEWKMFAGVQYIQPIGDLGNLTLNVDYSYTDDQYSDPSNSEVDGIDSYGLWNARLAWTPISERWELAAWGKNLSDKEYNTVNSDNFLETPRTVWGPPQLYGLSFTYFLGN
jgi:iron complex outermembrane receptor protein